MAPALRLSHFVTAATANQDMAGVGVVCAAFDQALWQNDLKFILLHLV